MPEVTEVTEPVEEPAGWATAPATAGQPPTPQQTRRRRTTPDGAAAEVIATAETATEDIPVVSTGDATPVAEPSPARARPRAAPEPAPAPIAAGTSHAAGWYPDPSMRYELRYWDGTQWTEHVARQGQQFTDPPVR